jgi:hypothetical protein
MNWFHHKKGGHPTLEEILEVEKKELSELEKIEQDLNLNKTPTSITFTGAIDMNPEGPGVTQVWTGVLSPAGSAFPAGTTFTATPSDPTVSATLDPTGLILTIVYPSTFVPNPTSPFSVAWATSTFAPSPSTSPASLTATITPSVPPPPTPTPTSVAFGQTS